MSESRRGSRLSHRTPKSVQDVFLGIALSFAPVAEGHLKPGSVRDLEYTIVQNDGTGAINSITFHFDYTVQADADGELAEAKKVAGDVLSVIRTIQAHNQTNVRVLAIAEPVPNGFTGEKGIEFCAAIWLHLDAIPFLVTPSTSIFTKLPAPSTQASATAAVAAAIKNLHPATHSATTAETARNDHEVLVDCDHTVKLCSLLQYQQTTSTQLWDRFWALRTLLVEQKTSIAFFSATPQGGGVALMRHALVRLARLADLDIKWYVPEGHPSVFDITKRKFHNVLQGVAPEGIELDDEDKKWFELWTEQNYETFWSHGTLDADLIVIDDPQLAALIPIIRKHKPNAKIIFRSHIQIQGHLVDDPSTPQARTWNYLFSFIKDADLFVAHPVTLFVPQNVKESLPVVYMAPCTDPLDGLNKPYGQASVRYYREHFNHLSRLQCGVTIDWERPYIIQIARFDPSKGIDDLLAAYLEFRAKLLQGESPPENGVPQLILMGHGSVDDPDGTVVYEHINDLLSTSQYAFIKEDVAVVRAPPSDAILGCILQGAWVATQLSTSEGFEVKVTEAVHKRVPVVASDAGGIPLQVKHGVNGWIIPARSTSLVAELLYDLYMGRVSLQREDVSEERTLDGKSDPNSLAQKFVGAFGQPLAKIQDGNGGTSEDFWTVGNAARWLLLASRVLGLPLPADQSHQRQRELLSEMGVGQQVKGTSVQEENVWKMVMGQDLPAGEGEVRVDA